MIIFIVDTVIIRRYYYYDQKYNRIDNDNDVINCTK